MLLDPFDIRILQAIQKAGDLTQAQLAEQAHLSPSQCARRLERLRRDGYVDRIVAHLNREKLGLGVMAHVLVSLREHGTAQNDRFRRFVWAAPEILECFMQTGEADLMLKVVVRDLDAFAILVERIIETSGGLAVLRSSIVVRTIKSSSELSLI